jgi:hypothetical protein
MITTRVMRGGAIVVAMTFAAIQAGVAGGQSGHVVGATAKNAALATCQTNEVGITLTQASPGASHHGYLIEFKNRGGACTITGYPGVDALKANGQRVLSAKRTKLGYLGGVASGPIPKVHLAKGKTASAIVEWIDLGPPCPKAQSLRITPPNAVKSVLLSPKSLKSETLCSVQIHPVVPGTTGQKR